LRKEYEDLKKKAVKISKSDGELYRKHKEGFIRKIIKMG